ncbi:MAG: hypothetical protein NWP79_11590 [Paracoccaceae bacterium]|nr:hypothetical protein [Paracoccaceae bacterium]
MIFAKLTNLAKRGALGTLGLRAGIVGINFVVMLGLAAFLGLETFGALAFLWGLALVAGTLLSLGGPLILLRALTDGGGLRGRDVIALSLIYPAILGLTAFGLLSTLWAELPWAVVLGVGFAVNLLGCLASVMRALGSVQWSMALRDAGPQMALGVGALVAGNGTAGSILIASAFVMGAGSLIVIFWCLRHERAGRLQAKQARPVWSASLYGTSVLGMVIAQIDLIIGGAVLPPEALGLYALLRRIANLVALPVSVATWVSAPPISAAHGANDRRGLAEASAAGSQIAFLPGTALFMIGLAALPIVTLTSPDAFAAEASFAFGILLIGALGQVVFASGYTVATLCGLARYAALARFLGILIYLLAVPFFGAHLSITMNALAYVVAMTAGGVFLWGTLRKRHGIDTSAMVLWCRKSGRWKLS